MSGTVLVRIEATRGLGNLTHDLDNSRRPSYVDHTKSHSNTILRGSDIKHSRNLLTEQSHFIKNDFNAEKNRQRELIHKDYLSDKEYISARRKVRNWQSHMKTHLSGFIGFSQDAHANKMSREQLDNCAIQYVEDLCSRKNIELTYLVRHEDETTVHYHFITTNYDNALKQTLRFKRDDLRKEQDKIGIAFTSTGLTRGLDKQARLKQAAEALNIPMENGKYSAEVWKQSNVIHRSVKQLHEDLPLEIEAKQKTLKELSKKHQAQLNKLSKNQRLILSNTEKLTQLESACNIKQSDIDKIKKRLIIYNKRVADAQTEIDILSLQFSPPKTERIEYVSSHTKNMLGQSKPVLKTLRIVSVKNAEKAYKAAIAKQKKLAQNEKRNKEQAMERENAHKKDKEAMEAFFKKQAFKHLKVFGTPIVSHSEILDFIKWFDMDSGWVTTKTGTRFKVQTENGKAIRVVVDSSMGSTQEVAKTLLYAAKQAGLVQGYFTGSDEVLIELWKTNQTSPPPIEIILRDGQEVMMLKEGLIDEREASFENSFGR
ncbi:MAG: hypothetical protein GXO35_08200 [Gammaproteobacteria bacterium]|nr:hypothetical protein [Gammaproteobacteria bacterium]